MQRSYRVASCAVAALALSACDVEEAEQSAVAAVQTCLTADQTWQSRAIDAGGAQLYRIDLEATPSAAPTDAVIGLAANVPSGFAQLATIVRFNATGTIDARDGGVYRADRVVSYAAGVTVGIRIEVDLRGGRYMVDVRRADGVTWDRIAYGFRFRTEQAGVTSLGYIATKLDGAGTLGLCHEAPRYQTTACAPVSAGDGFFNAPLASTSGVLVTDIVATPSTMLDGVIGLSQGAADGFGDLAAAFRFTPAGTLDARDAGSYRADNALAYTPGEPYRVRVIADLASHTYAVHAAHDYEAVEIAREHRFRTEQAAVAALDNTAHIVDSATGTLDLCDRRTVQPDVIFRRAGVHSVAADAGVISNGTTTQRIGERGEPLATFPRGGEVTADSAGNIYIARVVGTTLSVDSLTPAFALRWTRSFAASGSVTALGVTSADDITIVMTSSVRQLDATGASRWTRDLGPGAFAVPTRAGYAVASTSGASITVSQVDRDANALWSRTWPNDVDIHQLATNPAGQVILGGFFRGTITFGGASFEAYPGNEDGPRNTFVVALSPEGAHVFSNRMNERYVTAIASNGTQTIVSAHHYIGPISTTLYTFDAAGTQTGWREGLGNFGWFGRTYRLALSAAGRVFWSSGPTWPDNFTEWPQLVAY